MRLYAPEKSVSPQMAATPGGSTGGASACMEEPPRPPLVKLHRQGGDGIATQVLTRGEMRLDPPGLAITVEEVYGPGAPSPKPGQPGFPVPKQLRLWASS